GDHRDVEARVYEDRKLRASESRGPETRNRTRTAETRIVEAGHRVVKSRLNCSKIMEFRAATVRKYVSSKGNHENRNARGQQI
ncbi:hypothetical protein K0M31_006928, partial [Melipona bicolor]